MAFGVSPSKVYLAKIFRDTVKSFNNLYPADSLPILFIDLVYDTAHSLQEPWVWFFEFCFLLIREIQ